MRVEQNGNSGNIPPEMMAKMRATAPAPLPGTENLPPGLAQAITRINTMKPEIAQGLIKELNEKREKNPKAFAAMMNLASADPGMIINAYAMKKEGGSAEAWDKVNELAEAEKPPEKRGWLGRQMVRAKFMLKQGLKSGGIMALFTAAFKGGAHALDFKETAGTEYTQEARASNEALVGAKKIIQAGGTIPGWDKMDETQRNAILNAQPLNPIDPLNSIGKQAMMAGLAGTGLGATFAALGSGGVVASAEQERDMEIRVWNLMHGGAGDQVQQDPRMVAQAADIERPNVPNMGGAPSRGLFS